MNDKKFVISFEQRATIIGILAKRELEIGFDIVNILLQLPEFVEVKEELKIAKIESIRENAEQAEEHPEDEEKCGCDLCS
jgi:hypothetical protein